MTFLNGFDNPIEEFGLTLSSITSPKAKLSKFLSGAKFIMKFEWTTNSPPQTKKLGEILAGKIIQGVANKKRAQVFALIGGLGGGKTTFLQGFAKGLGIEEKILSPTFILMKKFKIPAKTYNLEPKTFIHIDCYRIRKTQEILDLDFKKIISDPKNIVVVEWADRIQKIIPKDAIWIRFELINTRRRKIKIMVK